MGAAPTSSSRTLLDAIGTLTLAALIVVSGFLARENVRLKETLALAGREDGRKDVGAGDRLLPLGLISQNGDRRVLFAEPGSTPALLLFFNTSCPHCENNLVNWNQFAELWADRRLEILGISLDDTGRTREYLARHTVRFPVASILEDAYIRRQGINGVPTTILVDTGATVVKAWPGVITPDLFLEIAREAASFAGD